MDLRNTVLGIELGSTRIKAVLVDQAFQPVASGSYGWENQYVDGVWTYSMEAIHTGLQACFADLKKDVENRFGVKLTTVGAMGVSAMMHGYLPFDREGKLLTPFRTWRNTMTGEAAEKLTKLFQFNIPQRWSIAHLYQAILNKEPHIGEIAEINTLAGYIHRMLTGERIIGIGDASGIFPIDSEKNDYNEEMLSLFDGISGQPWKLRDILPVIRLAGESGGKLTKEGALFLDPDGDLQPGIPIAPCEGDAGTGMVATNSVKMNTGNASAGTSDFAMIVTDQKMGIHTEIDMVTTPAGKPVAMVHCNNCTSDINAWASLFSEFAEMIGKPLSGGELFTMLFQKSLEGEQDAGGLLSYNYFSGEGVMAIDEGRPLFLRLPDARFTLANFIKSNLLSALATLKIGLDILTKEEKVKIDCLYGHGGFFKTPKVGQRILSAAANAPVSVMQTAGEGGPYGMALLAGYMLWQDAGETLEDYLGNKVFSGARSSTEMASQEEINGFNDYVKRYQEAFQVERTAVATFR